MKNLLLLPLFFLAFHTSAQNTYAEAIQQGDRALRQGQYKTAINKYFSAEAFDLTKKAVIREKVNNVFNRIEDLRTQSLMALDEAKAAREESQSTLIEIENAEKATQDALQKANKLINAFYFYEDKFALAYGEKNDENIFYFIDKNGDEVEKLGNWDKSEQFDRLGFANVKKWKNDELIEYFLDTFGHTYSAAYDLKLIDIRPKMAALDLSHKQLEVVPKRVFKNENLKILYLRFNELIRLPPEIENMQTLDVLNLSGNQLVTLPPEIGRLQNLKILNLKRNRWFRLPPEIGDLQNLLILDLSSINLNNLLVEIGMLKKLVKLNLSDNRLKYLPQEIKNLQNLAYLDLRNNLIPKEEQAKIQQLLPNCEITF